MPCLISCLACPSGPEGLAMQSVHTYMSCEAHAWSLFGSIQVLHPTCPGIVLNLKQRHIAPPSQGRDPTIAVSISILPLYDSIRTFRGTRKGFGGEEDSQPWQRRIKGNEKQSTGGQWREKHPSLTMPTRGFSTTNRSSALIRPSPLLALVVSWVLGDDLGQGRCADSAPVPVS